MMTTNRICVPTKPLRTSVCLVAALCCSYQACSAATAEPAAQSKKLAAHFDNPIIKSDSKDPTSQTGR